MNTLPLPEQRAALAQQLRAALAAVEAADAAAFKRSMDELVVLFERPVTDGVARLVSQVHAAIAKLDFDSRLAAMAGRELPDACNHLDYVIRMTETAAHRTLDLVESSKHIVGELTQRHAQLLTTADPEGGEALTRATKQLRAQLSELAQAQEYQDLSGQLIRRVITLVRNIETALVDLLSVSGTTLKDASSAPMNNAADTLPGPAGKSPSSQQDADALLADLGF